jgi:hypothetical protein
MSAIFSTDMRLPIPSPKFPCFSPTNSLLALNAHSNHRAEKTIEDLFSEIFRQHEQRLYTLAFHLVKSDEAAKDIIQV